MCHLNFSAPSSRSEPSPKAARQSLSIKQALLGGKSDGRIHSPHSPKTGEERRALKGKDISPIMWSEAVFTTTEEVIYVHLTCPDEASPPRDRAAWKLGIAGIMRRPFEKKSPAGVMFGVRLDDCPPAQTNRVNLSLYSCIDRKGLDFRFYIFAILAHSCFNIRFGCNVHNIVFNTLCHILCSLFFCSLFL